MGRWFNRFFIFYTVLWQPSTTEKRMSLEVMYLDYITGL